MNIATKNSLAEVRLAKAIAMVAHRGQLYGAEDYFEAHVDKVAARVIGIGGAPAYLLLPVAYLHDVLEDTGATADTLRMAGVSEQVIEAVEALTRREGETYAEYVLRAKQNPLAAIVKRADLEENLSNSPEGDSRRKRYEKALQALLE